MNNVYKLLTNNKESRIVIIDTQKIARKELSNFTGKSSIKFFLQETITSCALFAAMNDFHSKISFSFRLANNVLIFCEIKNNQLTLDYSEHLNTFSGKMTDLITEGSILSITTGDWNIGLHTGTVEISDANMNMVLAHFSNQSDQLPSHYIFPKNTFTRGVLLQPLPFANPTDIEKKQQTIREFSPIFEESSWRETPKLFKNIAYVLWENTLI